MLSLCVLYRFVMVYGEYLFEDVPVIKGSLLYRTARGL